MDYNQLLELLKLHTQEVHFQVQLNWDRAKSSLTFHAAMLALIAGMDKVMPRGFTGAMFLFVAVSSMLGAGIVHLGHGYYRKARNQRRAIEEQLPLAQRFATTPGMRESETGMKKLWPKVTTILIALHGLLAVLAVAGASIYLHR